MELVSAILGALGGVFNFLGVDRQASAAEAIARERGATARAFYDALARLGLSQERIAEIKARFGSQVAWDEARVQRARLLYNYMAFAAAQKGLVVVAGAGLLAFALYLAAKEEA